MPQPVVHFEISCKNVDAQQDFYQNVLGWSIQSIQPMDYRMVMPTDEEKEIPGIGGGLVHDDANSYVALYAHVDDIQAYFDKAEAAGGKVVLGPTEIGEGMG